MTLKEELEKSISSIDSPVVVPKKFLYQGVTYTEEELEKQLELIGI